MTAYVDPTKESFAAFTDLPRTGPIHMLNLLRFRERAAYEDGREVTGQAAYRTYGKAAAAVFRRVGGEQVWLGSFDLTLIGPSDERWDLAFVAAYPSADAFIEMVRDPEYREAVKHRQAAVADSRLIRITPRTPGHLFGQE